MHTLPKRFSRTKSSLRHDSEILKPQEYTFYSKPQGVYEEWHTQQRFVSNSGDSPENDYWPPETESFTHFGPLQVVSKEVEVELFVDVSKRGRMT
jgi:hypothetical protein